jgi:hypothetical protein
MNFLVTGSTRPPISVWGWDDQKSCPTPADHMAVISCWLAASLCRGGGDSFTNGSFTTCARTFQTPSPPPYFLSRQRWGRVAGLRLLGTPPPLSRQGYWGNCRSSNTSNGFSLCRPDIPLGSSNGQILHDKETGDKFQRWLTCFR